MNCLPNICLRKGSLQYKYLWALKINVIYLEWQKNEWWFDSSMYLGQWINSFPSHSSLSTHLPKNHSLKRENSQTEMSILSHKRIYNFTHFFSTTLKLSSGSLHPNHKEHFVILQNDIAMIIFSWLLKSSDKHNSKDVHELPAAENKMIPFFFLLIQCDKS